MANSREILAHMNGIRDTMKITNAMYLIASSKLQKVRKHVAQVDAYFEAVRDTIGDVLACMPELDHPYLEAKDARQAAEVFARAQRLLEGLCTLSGGCVPFR